MASTAELIFKITADTKSVKSELAQIRSELTQTAQVQRATNQGELSMKQQLAAAASLQRQRSAALIQQWKQQEAAAKQLASGIRPVGENLQKLSDIMGGLRASTAVMEGPLGGVAGRLGSVSTLAADAGGSLTKMTAAMGPVGVAAAGIVVQLAAAGIVIGAVAKAGAGLFETFFGLAQSAAGFRGNLFDLSQQTGVSVETLNALEIVASKTGGSIDSVAQSLVIFQGRLDEAQIVSSKTAKEFRDLGISTTDTETALRDALRSLAKMPEGFHQTTLAAELFSKRGGKQFLAILKETNGDIDSAVSKLGDLARVTQEEARQADEFLDLMRDFHILMRGLGKEAIPPALEALKALGKLLQENRAFIDALGGAFTLFGMGIKGGFIDPIVLALDAISPLLQRELAKWQLLASAVNAVADAAARLSAGANAFPGATGGASGSAGVRSGLGQPDVGLDVGGNLFRKKGRTIGGGGARKGKAKTDTALAEALKEAAIVEKEASLITADNVARNKENLDAEAQSIKEFTEAAIKYSDERFNAVVDRTNAEAAALQIALNKKLVTQAEFDRKWREQGVEVEAARQKNAEEVDALEDERDRKISAAEQAARERGLQIAEEADQRQIERIQRRIEKEIAAESEGLKEIAGVIATAFARKKAALEEEESAYATTLERREAITGELVRLEGERAFAAEKASQRVIDAVEKEARARFDAESRGFGDATRPRSVNAQQLADLQAAGPFQTFGTELKNLGIVSDETSQIIGGTLTTAFQSLASGVGQALQAFLLFGKVEGGFRRLAAEIVSSLAAAATVQAIYQLAQGLAWLALNAFFPNPKYAAAAGLAFASAAVFGTIGAAASIASVGLRDKSAGISSGQSSGGSTGGGSFRDNRSTSEPEARDYNRRNMNVPNATLTLVVPQGWLGNEMKKDYDLNGYSRMLIREAP